MNARTLTLIAGMALALASGAVFAKKDGGSGGSKSDMHMSTQGMENTNGPNAADRDKGLQRADDRMSQQGTSHSNAEETQTKHKKGKKK